MNYGGMGKAQTAAGAGRMYSKAKLGEMRQMDAGPIYLSVAHKIMVKYPFGLLVLEN
jgi:hypothetical protein